MSKEFDEIRERHYTQKGFQIMPDWCFGLSISKKHFEDGEFDLVVILLFVSIRMTFHKNT